MASVVLTFETKVKPDRFQVHPCHPLATSPKRSGTKPPFPVLTKGGLSVNSSNRLGFTPFFIFLN